MDAPAVEEVDEQQAVYQWRLKCAYELGIPSDVADLFASGTGDLGVLRSLVAAGCPLDLAARIVI